MSKSITMTDEYTVTINDIEMDVSFELTAMLSHTPAKLGGAWEDCHPEESDYELTDIVVLEKVAGYSEKDLCDALIEEYEAKIEEEFWERFQDSNNDYDDSRD